MRVTGGFEDWDTGDICFDVRLGERELASMKQWLSKVADYESYNQVLGKLAANLVQAYECKKRSK